jgi:xanthine dehydrogenase accessory factor
MSDLVTLAQEIEPMSEPFVLVTLVSVSGSTYRKPGARLIVTPFQTFGLLSGGCLEQEIAGRCQPILNNQVDSLFLEIDTRQYLGCDGRLGIWCERAGPDLLAAAKTVASKRQKLFCNTYPNQTKRPSTVTENADGEAFAEELLPPRRLLVFGSAPDSRPLVELGRALKWQTEQVVLASDPVAGSDPSWKVLAEARMVERLQIDMTTACIVMNHHFGRDLELLQSLWTTATPFLGLLGSRKRRDHLLEKLAFGRTELNLESRELYAPVGLVLNAEGPYQIALEICAQVQQVMASV